MKSFTKNQKSILNFLAKNGPKNMYQINKENDMNYAAVHRSMLELHRMGLVFQSGKNGKMGPKAAIEFSLTPNGISITILENEQKHMREENQLKTNMTKISKEWIEIMPKFMRYLNMFKEAGYEKEVLDIAEFVTTGLKRVAEESVAKGSSIWAKPFSDYIGFQLLIDRNILDQNFLLYFVLKYLFIDYGTFTDIISKDPEYQKIWVDTTGFVEGILNNLQIYDKKMDCIFIDEYEVKIDELKARKKGVKNIGKYSVREYYRKK